MPIDIWKMQTNLWNPRKAQLRWPDLDEVAIHEEYYQWRRDQATPGANVRAGGTPPPTITQAQAEAFGLKLAAAVLADTNGSGARKATTAAILKYRNHQGGGAPLRTLCKRYVASWPATANISDAFWVLMTATEIFHKALLAMTLTVDSPDGKEFDNAGS